MILPIHIYGEEILRNKSRDVDLNNEKLQPLINDMFETMANAKGVGLAAPQIGINKNIVVVNDSTDPNKQFYGVFINPKIIWCGGSKITNIEGCLSFPGISIDVSRPSVIDVEWYDENKKYHCETFMGNLAIILQHEIDHLNGTLFIDKMNSLDRLKTFMDLENIRKKKIASNYPIK